jgi:hypothetical protein
MTCCDYGTCTQGRDCPIRKQRIEATNQAYIERGRVVDTDPYAETVGSVKSLIALMFVVAGLTMVAFAIWGK